MQTRTALSTLLRSESPLVRPLSIVVPRRLLEGHLDLVLQEGLVLKAELF